MFNKYNNNAKKLGNLLITLKNKCEELNAFFSNVGKTISAKISKPPVIYKHFLNQINFKDSIFLAPTDANEITIILNN